MNALKIATIAAVVVTVWTSIARADDVMVCNAPRPLEQGHGNVQECKVMHTHPTVRDAKGFTINGVVVR